MNAAETSIRDAVHKPATTPLTAEERARRIAAVEAATGNLRVEGMYLSPEMNQLNQQYIDGEIDHAGMIETLNRWYKR